MKLCAVIPPRLEQMTHHEAEDCSGECIREAGHVDPHVLALPSGQLVAWEDDYSCDCCAPDEDDRCTLYWEISQEAFSRFV